MRTAPERFDVGAREPADRGAPRGVIDGAVLISGEKIVAVVAGGEIPSSCPVEDVADRVVLPGLVDAHVHINEPGRTEWEGFETATRAAAAGGITSLFDMPLNSSPVTTTAVALELKLEAARASFGSIVGFMGASCRVCEGRSGRFRVRAWRGSRRFSVRRASTSFRTRVKPISGRRCPSWPRWGCRSWCTPN